MSVLTVDEGISDRALDRLDFKSHKKSFAKHVNGYPYKLMFYINKNSRNKLYVRIFEWKSVWTQCESTKVYISDPLDVQMIVLEYEKKLKKMNNTKYYEYFGY